MTSFSSQRIAATRFFLNTGKTISHYFFVFDKLCLILMFIFFLFLHEVPKLLLAEVKTRFSKCHTFNEQFIKLINWIYKVSILENFLVIDAS